MENRKLANQFLVKEQQWSIKYEEKKKQKRKEHKKNLIFFFSKSRYLHKKNIKNLSYLRKKQNHRDVGR